MAENTRVLHDNTLLCRTHGTLKVFDDPASLWEVWALAREHELLEHGSEAPARDDL